MRRYGAICLRGAVLCCDLLHGHTSQRRENDTVSSDYIVDCYPDTGGKRGQLMDSHDCDTCRYREHTNGQLPCSKCKGGDCWESEEDD